MAVYGAPIVAIFDRPVPILGLQVGAAVAALAVFGPALAAQWKHASLPRPIQWGMGLLLAGGVLALFFAPDLGTASLGVVTWALALNYAIGVVGYARQQPGTPANLALLVSALGALVAALGLLQGAGHYTVVGPPFAADRIDSTFGYYSNYGNFVALAAVVSLGATLALAADGRGRAATAAAGFAALNGYAAVTSLSRGAILCLTGGAVVLILLNLRRLTALLAIALTTAGVGLITYLAVPDNVWTELADRFSQEPGGDLTRRTLQHAGRELMTSTPVGIGFGNFRDVVTGSGVAVGRTILAHCHELYVQIGLDLGWLGLAGFLLLVLGALSVGVRTAWAQPVSYAAAFTAALTGVLVQGFNDYFFFETASLVAFVVLLAGCLASASVPPGTTTQRRTAVTAVGIHAHPTRKLGKRAPIPGRRSVAFGQFVASRPRAPARRRRPASWRTRWTATTRPATASSPLLTTRCRSSAPCSGCPAPTGRTRSCCGTTGRRTPASGRGPTGAAPTTAAWSSRRSSSTWSPRA
jgi:hypothetical protein